MTSPASSDRAASEADVHIAPARSIEELARAQNVPPVEKLDELSARWPSESDPDDLDEFLARHRAERRACATSR